MTIDHPSVLPGEHLAALRGRIRGPVFLPGDPEWDVHRRAWQLLADQRPAAIVVPADAADVAAAVVAAGKLGLSVAPQATGHAAGAIGCLEGTILLRTSGLGGIEVDPATARMRVGAGVVWADAVAAAAEHGLAGLAGMAPSVGVAGYSLGGGLGWFARSHGLAANSIRSIDIVDARGRTLRIDDAHHPDLFWAARGGNAPVIVTAIELQLYPIDEVWAGGMLWPIERAADVAHAWREWIATVPETVTSLARVLRYPPLPEIPEIVRGRSFVAVEAAIQEDATTVAGLLEPLRALAPEVDSVRPMPPAELASVHGDPVDPVPAYGDAIVLSEISADCIDALVTVALAPSSAALVAIEVRQLGGMLTPGRAHGGAVSSIPAAGLVHVVSMVPGPDALARVRDAVSLVLEALRPYASETTVKNFAEAPADPESLYGPALERLRGVAAEWDPAGLIRLAHPLS